MYVDMIFSFVIGGFVGFIGHVRKHGKMVMPRKTKKFLYLGFIQEMLLGAFASLLLVLYTALNSIVEMILYSVIAGIVGDADILRFKFLNRDNHKNNES
ncbi:DUF4257 domain-containing protein [Neobacillus muris]|uniref:DUF4257 domain-containing protein n=1 Tax=Neobacillus muris TaxID=2941334 RepID=UPI00204096A4|nr:DUF4257 domain-containing protein [Neobacillus muris]